MSDAATGSASAGPRDRPPLSMPRGAIGALLLLYLLLGSVPALLLMVAGPATGSAHDLLDAWFLPYVAVTGGWLLALLFIVRSGRIVGLRLLRGTAALLAAMLAAGLVAAALLATGTAGDAGRAARLTGQFALFGLAICLPLQWLLLRALRRVRWLDPTSSPDEWEPPFRRAAPRR